MTAWITNIDSSILMFIQEHIRNPILTPFFQAVTSLGNAGMIWILITALLLIPKKTRKIGLMSLFALAGSLLVNNIILKNLVARIRPYDTIEGLVPLVAKPVDWSFPSGHTGSSFASACVLYRKLPKRLGIPALVLAVLIALSRLYVGVHYPSDVLVGMIDGIALGWAGEMIVNCSGRFAEG